MVIFVAVPSYISLSHTRWGRYIFAVGSNPELARLSGVRVQAIIYLAYGLSGVFAAFVGVLLATRIGIGNATQADGWELQAIASSVIGGTSLFGAIGSVHGPLDRRIHSRHHQQRRQLAERELVLATDYHRRVDYPDRVLRSAAATRTVTQ